MSLLGAICCTYQYRKDKRNEYNKDAEYLAVKIYPWKFSIQCSTFERIERFSAAECPSSDHVLGNTVVRQMDSTQQPFTEVGAFPFECTAQIKNNVRQRIYIYIFLN